MVDEYGRIPISQDMEYVVGIFQKQKCMQNPSLLVKKMNRYKQPLFVRRFKPINNGWVQLIYSYGSTCHYFGNGRKPKEKTSNMSISDNKKGHSNENSSTT